MSPEMIKKIISLGLEALDKAAEQTGTPLDDFLVDLLKNNEDVVAEVVIWLLERIKGGQSFSAQEIKDHLATL